MRLTVLGSGTSSGVPTIGCGCRTCTSVDPRDQRTRPSVWITTDSASIVIDTSSDFRTQCLIHDVRRLDGVIYTHHHFDHIAGFDDLRAFNYTARRPVELYAMPETLNHLRHVFNYAFAQDNSNPSSTPSVQVTLLTEKPFQIAGIEFTPIPLQHGNMRVNGYRFGNAAYCTDCNYISPESMEAIRGVDVLILDALRQIPHPTHFTIEQAVNVARAIGARETYFTHIAHDILHDEVEQTLPDNIHLAYDGLAIDLP